MFVLSVKVTAFKIAAVAVVLALGVTLTIVLWPREHVEASTTPTSSQRPNTTGITTNEKRIAFIESYGWKVNPEPVEVVELTIPQTFNDVYNNYNTIQKKQGFDLTKFKGERCKRWTYRITNYPGVEGEVRVNLLIANGRVIGGDVSTVALDGFMHGFTPPQNTDNLSAVTPASADITTDIFTSIGDALSTSVPSDAKAAASSK